MIHISKEVSSLFLVALPISLERKLKMPVSGTNLHGGFLRLLDMPDFLPTIAGSISRRFQPILTPFFSSPFQIITQSAIPTYYVSLQLP